MHGFYSIAALHVITIDSMQNPKEVLKMVKALVAQCEGKLKYIELWTGAKNWKEKADCYLASSSGEKQLENTFISQHIDDSWMHTAFSRLGTLSNCGVSSVLVSEY
jgi:hypothetical protein